MHDHVDFYACLARHYLLRDCDYNDFTDENGMN